MRGNVSWRADFEGEMETAQRELEQAATEAMGEFFAELGPWDIFGGETFDQRRRRFQRIETRTTEPVCVGGKWVWGYPVVYDYIHELPRKVGVDSTRKAFQNFITRGRKALGRRIEYAAAVESQKNGWPHLHPLLKVEDGLRAGDMAALGRIWWQEYGLNKLAAPRSQEDVAGYCAKYLTKDLASGALLLSPRLGQRKPETSLLAIANASTTTPTRADVSWKGEGIASHPSELPGGGECQ
jgi:hypothetical protein